jgi:hypothetical protein
MPHFDGSLIPVRAAYDRAMGAGDKYVTATLNAQLQSIAQYQAEREAKQHA